MDGTEPVLAASGTTEVAATKDVDKAEVEAAAKKRPKKPDAKKRPKKPEAKKCPRRPLAKRRPEKPALAKGVLKVAGTSRSWKPWKGSSKYTGYSKEREKRLLQISRRLIKVLRHTATDLGIHIRPDGFCEAKELLATNRFRDLNCTREDLKELVRTNSKQRFELRTSVDGDLLVRAAQGHSIDIIEDDSLLLPLGKSGETLPDVCVHGTYRKYLAGIMSRGLIPGGVVGDRRHVHFSPFEPGDRRIISGMRSDSELAIYLDLKLALNDGVPFFWSSNTVILSPGVDGRVPAKYVQKIWDVQKKYWLAETPDAVKDLVASMERNSQPAAKKRPIKVAQASIDVACIDAAIEAAIDEACSGPPSAKKMPRK